MKQNYPISNSDKVTVLRLIVNSDAHYKLILPAPLQEKGPLHLFKSHLNIPFLIVYKRLNLKIKLSKVCLLGTFTILKRGQTDLKRL